MKRKRQGTAASNTNMAGEMQGEGSGLREAHLATKAPWMSPRPGEDEARSELTPPYYRLSHRTIYIHTYIDLKVQDGSVSMLDTIQK